jgi:hypothetical protein
MMNAEKIDMHKLALLGESEQFQESGESMFDSIKQQTIAIQRLRVAVVVIPPFIRFPSFTFSWLCQQKNGTNQKTLVCIFVRHTSAQ